MPEGLPAPETWPTDVLIYADIYDGPKPNEKSEHGFWTVRRPKKPKTRIFSIREVRQACQLVPAFTGDSPPDHITAENVLDAVEYNAFFINNYTDLYSYQTIY